eukprot:scaffold6301_cov169-Pinguiococcus_pyrenoidosus.AAC.1
MSKSFKARKSFKDVATGTLPRVLEWRDSFSHIGGAARMPAVDLLWGPGYGTRHVYREAEMPPKYRVHHDGDPR